MPVGNKEYSIFMWHYFLLRSQSFHKKQAHKNGFEKRRIFCKVQQQVNLFKTNFVLKKIEANHGAKI